MSLQGQVDATAGHLTDHLSPKSAILGLTSDCNPPSTGFSVLQAAPFYLISTGHPVSPKQPCGSPESSLVLREQLASLFSWFNSFGDDEDVDVVESVDGIVWPVQVYSVPSELIQEYECCKQYLELATQSTITEAPDPVLSETCCPLPEGPHFPSTGPTQEPQTPFHGIPFRDGEEEEMEFRHVWLDQSYTFPTDLKNVTGKSVPHVEETTDCPQPHSVVVEFLNTPMERMLLKEFKYDCTQYTTKLHALVDLALYIIPPGKPEPSPASVPARLASKPQSSSPSSPSPRQPLASSAPTVPSSSNPPRKRLNSGLSRLGLKSPPPSPPPEPRKSSSAEDVESRTSTTPKRPSPLRKVCDFSQPDRTKVIAMVDRFNRVCSRHRSPKPRGKPGSRSKLLPKEVAKQRRFSGGYRSALLKTALPPPPSVKAKGKSRENVRPQ